ncbi:alpha/beta hydrolase [Hamadaea sp. NPDC051192]|uniref:alpha/beta fold hydrolase n=1 Tax=Hamadaea sp. NPDC051192 TaxID=3154940 RepID=UPI00343F01B2
MFEGFQQRRVDVGGGVILRAWTGGSGPPVLLLPGRPNSRSRFTMPGRPRTPRLPRTPKTWHEVAPMLAVGFTVVCPDLSPFGEPAQQAADCVRLMAQLGHRNFAAVGPDRGAYVAQRLATDHPELVSHLVVIDALPLEAPARITCPTLVLWSTEGADLVARWQVWADAVRGVALGSGPGPIAAAPDQVAQVLRDFLGGPAGPMQPETTAIRSV